MPTFVPRQRKHKVLARQKATKPDNASTNSNNEANAVQIVPLSRDEREFKRQKLREEIRAQQPQISAKKQKRLDKFIEKKLKKDENLELVRKLEKEKEKWDASGLTSSRNLRKRGFETYIGDQTRRNGDRDLVQMKQEVKSDKLQNEIQHQDVIDDTDSEDSFEIKHHGAFDENSVLGTDHAWMAKHAPRKQGEGLAQPLEKGPNGRPIIPTRMNQNRKIRPIRETRALPLEEVPWEGFDSELDEEVADISTDKDKLEVVSTLSSQDEFEVSDGDSGEYNSNGEDSDEGSDSDTSTSASSQQDTKLKPRASAFKAWATQQLHQAIGHTPSYAANGEGELLMPKQHHATLKSTEPVREERVKLINGLPEVITPTVSRSIYSIQVKRPSRIEELRIQLPIIQREQEIMEAIYANSVVFIKGDTGSGKTTQLPQFLYEAGYGDPNGPAPGMIGITQPRRVAAVSMAKRVSEELGDHGARVAHQIRFDSSVSANTAIKFMTDGILLRELSQDLLLKKYSAIIIDEAHERSVNTDILIGMLSKIVPARMRKDRFNPDPKPLKLIIMSATLNIGEFLHDKLFTSSKPPVVEVEGRQHRVTTHFALRSRADYLEETIEKVKRAHRKLPRGGMLIFLTGQHEIKQVQMRLQKELSQPKDHYPANIHHTKLHIAANETPLEVEDVDFGSTLQLQVDGEDEVDILTHSDEEAEDREFEISDNDDGYKQLQKINSSVSKADTKEPYDSVYVLPLYSQLPTIEQLRVFETPPDRSRLIVLATNIAETSLTIPGIRFVFDCGRSKERKYNLETGVQSFEIDYISKASAQQRAGRAGRTGAGHCWRLYSSAVYEQFFPDYTEPEILRAPAETIVLQIKGFAYPKPVVEFPFPTAPTLQTLDKAEQLLKTLGALTTTGTVTSLGKELSIYPLSPRLGKILASAVKDGKDILSNAISLVAGLAVGDIYVNDATLLALEDENEYLDAQNQRKQKYGRAQAILSKHDKSSDAMKLLTTVSMYTDTSDKQNFCEQYFVKSKAMKEISLLVQQLGSIVSANHPGALGSSTVVRPRSKLSSGLIKLTNSVAASGYIDQVAIRWDCAPSPPTLLSKPRQAIDVPYLPLIPLKTLGSSELIEKAFFIHPSSVLSRLSTKDLPQYIIYTHLQQSQARTIAAERSIATVKTRMCPLTPIDAASLVQLAKDTALIEYGKPIPKMKVEDVLGTPRRRICWVSAELRGAGGTGSFGWPLPAVKVRQIMDVKSPTGWRVEEVLS